MKRALVESYVGAIALGYLLAQCVFYFAATLAAPVAQYVSESEYHHLMPDSRSAPTWSLNASASELVHFVVGLVVWYLLLRWLYISGKVDRPAVHSEHGDSR